MPTARFRTGPGETKPPKLFVEYQAESVGILAQASRNCILIYLSGGFVRGFVPASVSKEVVQCMPGDILAWSVCNRFRTCKRLQLVGLSAISVALTSQ